MYKKLGLTLLSVGVFLFGCAMGVPAQEEGVEIAEEVIEPLTPPRLFVAPTANVIRSLDVSLVGGGSYGAGEAEQSESSFLGAFAFGLADIAQIEIGTMGITGALKGGTIPKPSIGFKMKLLPEGKHWPGVAASVRVSMWTNEDKETSIAGPVVTYSTKTSDFYLVASKTIELPSEQIRSISVHGGLDIFDARLKSSIMEEEKKDPATKSTLAPFGGLEIWVTEKGKTMIEVGRAPCFAFDLDLPNDDGDPIGEQVDDDISTVWVGTLGVRFFVTRHLAADVGVTYRGDFKGVSDTLIGAKLEISIPTRLAYEALRR